MARLSLTKSQVSAGPGIELLALCQTITEDGSLSDAEIGQLRDWLTENREGELPAIGFLTSIVETILQDGKVTKAERQELYRALEKVLPIEVREAAASRRRLASAKEREEAKEQKKAEKERRTQERLRDSPIGSANFMVAGVLHEGRDKVIAQYARAGDTAYLVRDTDNRYSRNAIEIRLGNGMQIGFVPEDDAIALAPLLDKGALQTAIITKILDGRRGPIPVVDVDLYGVDAQVSGAVAQSQAPQSVMQEFSSAPTAAEPAPLSIESSPTPPCSSSSEKLNTLAARPSPPAEKRQAPSVESTTFPCCSHAVRACRRARHSL